MYKNFAYVYDKLMYDVDYGAWADYIEEMFKKQGLSPKLILDLGCGTGSLCMEMAKRGYDMIGIDLSEDMLSCAREKSSAAGLDILYLNQDMTEFELYGTVDAILCLMDSMNYITSKNDVKKVLKLVKNYLNPEGLFVFDINTEYKLKEVLGNNVFYDVGEDITYIWQNRYDSRSATCEFDLTFFIKEEDTYRRYEELHVERAYSVEEMKEIIRETGLDLIEIYHDLSFKRRTAKSQRVFFQCRRK